MLASVAGTSCVDYSPLNTEKKTIKAGGESGRTFFGMIDYVTRHSPKVIILENVSSAPWGAVCEEFAKIEYNATYVRLDTKCVLTADPGIARLYQLTSLPPPRSYYIPHTRSRGCALPTRTSLREIAAHPFRARRPDCDADEVWLWAD